MGSEVDTTDEEARRLFRIIVEIGLGQDQRADKLLEVIERLEELARMQAFLLEQTSTRLMEKNIAQLMEEEEERQERSELVKRKDRERWRKQA